MSKRKQSTDSKARKMQQVFENPIWGKWARQVGEQRIKQYTTWISLHLYHQTPGTLATEYLARLGWLISLAAEVELQANGLTTELRRLHGGARQIQQWCLDGYTWPDIDVRGLDELIQLATQKIKEHPAHAIKFMPGANDFEAAIAQRKVTPESISGAEIYKEAA